MTNIICNNENADLLRIAKLISSNSKYSRRAAEKLITENRVHANGVQVTSLAQLVAKNTPVTIDGIPLKINQEVTRIWLFNKPKGVITSRSDPLNRATIYNLLPSKLETNIYVGRLDYNSEGLLLLTNNGELANQLTLAKNKIIKRYKVKVFGYLDTHLIYQLVRGIKYRGIYYMCNKVTIISTNNKQSWLSFELTEGKNNEIRKICEFMGLKVSKLIRVQFDCFTLNNLTTGQVKEAPSNLVLPLVNKLLI